MTDDAVLESLKTIRLTLASHTSALGQIRTDLAPVRAQLHGMPLVNRSLTFCSRK